MPLTPSRPENETASNERDRVGTRRSEPAAQRAKALVGQRDRFPAAPQKTRWSTHILLTCVAHQHIVTQCCLIRRCERLTLYH